MLPQATADLTPVVGTWRGHSSCEEVLVRPPPGHGDHWWVRAVKTDLSTAQCRAAISRAGAVPEDHIASAGNRERNGRCTQWFSIPGTLLEHPQALRTAGFQGQVSVVEVAAAPWPITPDSVERLRWQATLRGGAADEGYRRATAILDRLRQVGCPNYIAAERLGPGAQHAKWGKLIAQGRRLPRRVAAAKVAAGRCLTALQGLLFNRWLAQRVADGLLATCLPGERLRGNNGDEEIVADAAAGQGRLDSWEAVQLGPWFGVGMAEVAGEALVRETAALAAAGLEPRHLGRLRGARRALRIQPAKSRADIAGGDLVIHAELPVDAYLAVLLEELIKPGKHL